MAKIDKLKERFFKVPIPTDISYDELKKLAEYYGCETDSGGKHPLKIIYKKTGTVIPIPRHGSTVPEVYIKQVKALFEEIEKD